MHVESGDASEPEASLMDMRKCDVPGVQGGIKIHRIPDDLRIWEFHAKALLDVL